MYSIYYLILNDDYSIIHYVGITSKPLKERLQSHLYQCKNKHYQNKKHQKGYLQRFLLKHAFDTISLVEIESELSRSEAIETEKLHIQKLKPFHPLKNTSSGGEVFLESAHTYKVIKKYTLDGELCASYNGSTSAAFSVGLSSKGKINDCCNGKLHHVKGFVWRYENDSFDKYSIYRKDTNEEFRIYNIDGTILQDKVKGLKKVKEVLNLSPTHPFNTRNIFTKTGTPKTILGKYIVINLKYTNHITEIEKYFNLNYKAIRYSKSNSGCRINNIKNLFIVFSDLSYIEFTTILKFKEVCFGTIFSRTLSTYVVKPTFFKSKMFIFYDSKKLSQRNIKNIAKKLEVSEVTNFQEIKDIVRSIGKPMTIEEFLAKIQEISIVS